MVNLICCSLWRCPLCVCGGLCNLSRVQAAVSDNLMDEWIIVMSICGSAVAEV